jgi:hypothetical protein
MVEIFILNLKIKVNLLIIVEERLLKNAFKEVNIHLIRLLEKEQHLPQMLEHGNMRMEENYKNKKPT